ncbi:MAG: hypothetical protein ACK562_11995 [Acidobacteriota bacterium]
MKQVVNSYAAKSVISVDHGREFLIWARDQVGLVSSFAWLMIIVLTISALTVSTYLRKSTELREARASVEQTTQRVEQARSLNASIRRQTDELRHNSQAGKLAAKERLRMVARHEVVVAVK